MLGSYTRVFTVREKKARIWRTHLSNISSNFFSANKQAAQQPFSLFSGAVISGGHISVAIDTLNQSPTLSLPEEDPSKTYKRIKPLDSDFV